MPSVVEVKKETSVESSVKISIAESRYVMFLISSILFLGLQAGLFDI